MNDLLQTMALAGPGTGGQWVNSSDNLDGPEDVEGGGSGGQRMKELGSMAYSTNAIDYATLSLPAGHRGRQKLRVKGQNPKSQVGNSKYNFYM